jgi:hypothetical protein
LSTDTIFFCESALTLLKRYLTHDSPTDAMLYPILSVACHHYFTKKKVVAKHTQCTQVTSESNQTQKEKQKRSNFNPNKRTNSRVSAAHNATQQHNSFPKGEEPHGRKRNGTTDQTNPSPSDQSRAEPASLLSKLHIGTTFGATVASRYQLW